MSAKLLSRTKKIAGALVVLAAVSVPGAARAQTINFAGFTNGCFGSCNVQALSTSNLQIATLGNPIRLRYQNSQFNTTVANGGSVNLNAPFTPLGTQNFNNFGSFYVSCGPTCTVNLNTTFTLLITLTSPTSSQVIFNGLLTGVLHRGAQGLQLAFTNTPQNVTWTAGAGGGTATININGVSANGGADIFNLSGTIRAQVTPEPATMVLFGTGLFGVFGAAYRRRRNKKDEQTA